MGDDKVIVVIYARNKADARNIKTSVSNGLKKSNHISRDYKVKIDNKEVIIELPGDTLAPYQVIENAIGRVKSINYWPEVHVCSEILTQEDNGKVSNLEEELLNTQLELKRIEKQLEKTKRSKEMQQKVYSERLSELETTISKLRDQLSSSTSIREEMKIKYEQNINNLKEQQYNLIEDPTNIIQLLGNYAKDNLKNLEDQVKHLEEVITFKNKLEEAGLENITEEEIKEILPEAEKPFEETSFYKENYEDYIRAKDDLEFKKRYESREKFNIPKHRLAQIIEDIDVEKCGNTIERFERYKKLREVVKDASKIEINLEIEPVKIPYVVISNRENKTVSIYMPFSSESKLATYITEKSKKLLSALEEDEAVISINDNETDDIRALWWNFSPETQYRTLRSIKEKAINLLKSSKELNNEKMELQIIELNMY